MAMTGALAVLHLGMASAAVNRANPDAAACSALADRHDGSVRVTRASVVSPPFTAEWEGVPGAHETVVNRFCRVEARTRSVPGSDIRFEVWLPARGRWNGRLLGVGAGGSLGAINRLDLGLGVNRGFAAVATDNGHHGYAWNDSSWALGHPERVEDFGYRAHHLATVAAKELVHRFYGTAAQHSYYWGCSQGGTQGMMAAQRFPSDYDGILAGAPVYAWSREMTFQAWNFRALTARPGAAIAPSQMSALHQAVIKQCGGPDGLVDDPRHCSFDPAVLTCTGSATGVCLTPLQVEAVKQLYRGPHTTSGIALNRGLTPGSESTWPLLWDLSDADPTRSGSWYGVYRYMVFGNPRWDPRTLDFDRDPERAKSILGPVLDSDNVDLTVFRQRGGRLIVFHGWADHMVPAQTSTDYHEAVSAKFGRAATDEFFRLFMVPGLAHCAGGPGAGELLQTSDTPAVPLDADHDLLMALQRWVETGQAPSHLIASKTDESNRVLRTRLLCPEPQEARLRPDKDPMRDDSWECVSRP